jgi:hypothetical protein
MDIYIFLYLSINELLDTLVAKYIPLNLSINNGSGDCDISVKKEKRELKLTSYSIVKIIV